MATVTEIQDLIENISKAVGSGDSAEQARQILRDMSGNTPEKKAQEDPEVPEVEGLKIDTRTVLRPNGENYHVRNLGDHDDVAALRKARQNGLPILAYGPPGTGKTALIEAAYCEGDQNVHTVQGTGDTETADFIGSFSQLPGGHFQWTDGPLLQAMERGEVLYIDEIALIDPKVMAIVYSVMDGRGEFNVTQNPERGIVKSQDGFYVAAACNPNAPGARLSEAILSRFVLQFEVLTDYSLAKKLGVPKKLVNAAKNMQGRVEKSEMGWAPQLRECLAFKSICDALGEDAALRNVIASAPEIDRPVVQDILQRTYSKSIKALAID